MRRTYQRTVQYRDGRKRREKHEVLWSIDKPESSKPDEWVRQLSWIDRQIEVAEGGYHSNNVQVTFCADGAMFFANDDIEKGIIYLYPEQVGALKALFRMKKKFKSGG